MHTTDTCSYACKAKTSRRCLHVRRDSQEHACIRLLEASGEEASRAVPGEAKHHAAGLKPKS